MTTGRGCVRLRFRSKCAAGSIPMRASARLPDVLQVLESLEVVFLFQSAFDSELGEKVEHLSHANSRQLGSAANRGLSLFILFDCKQDSAASDHVTDGFRQISTFFLCYFMEEF